MSETKCEVVRVRVPSKLKSDATAILTKNELSISLALRLFLVKVVESNGLPFDVRITK